MTVQVQCRGYLRLHYNIVPDNLGKTILNVIILLKIIGG